jgi:ATP-dependent exoDNAse (exonuclease V) alpha subunit
MLVRESKDIDNFKTNDNRVVFVSKYDYNTLEKFFYQMYVKRSPMESVTLSLFNNTRVRNNSIIRKVCSKGNTPEKDDIVICLKNVHFKTHSIFNGMRGVVENCFDVSNDHYEMEIDFPFDDIQICENISKHQFNQPYTFGNIYELNNFGLSPKKWSDVGLLFDYGYSLTCHKSQGDSYENVMVFVERMKNSNDEYFNRWLYTAITRSSINLAIVK